MTVPGKSNVSSDEPRLQVEYWTLDRLIPYARNARTHSEAQVAEIAGSIRTFGFSNPILVSEAGDIIAGHGRLAAARKLGLAEAPVVVLRGLTDFERRQLVLADNKIALNAGWDAEMLSLELADLSGMGADLSTLGFTTKELSRALSRVEGGLTDEDEVPEIAELAVSQPGDIWQLGSHRIACGDSRDANLVTKLFAGTVPQLMVTDPPYGVEYDPEWRHRRGVNNSARKGKIKNDEIADWTPTWDLFPGEIAYVWHGALRSTIVADSLAKSRFTIRGQIIWAKERLVMSQGDYHWQHEPCWYAVRKKGNWTGDRKQTTLWTISSGGQDAETAHATQKPVECMRRPMLNNSSPGQAIYEPFLGSGTTLIAAQSCGRVCLGIEIDPLFVDLAIRRWQTFTGEKAKRASGGVLFDALFVQSRAGRGGDVMRGRRPKPTRIKALTGNPGKRPLNPHEPRPEPAAPDCPPELSPLARQEWMRLTAELAKLNLISHLDRGALATYCGAYAFWAEAMEQIQKYGTMVKSPTGYPIQSPYLSIANRQAELMMRVASEFGFTPASRSRISTPPPDQLPLLDLNMDEYEEEPEGGG